MYQRPLRPDELMHWGIKKGEEAKKHKYFQRELIGTNNGRNIYKYYYTKAEYDRAHNASIQQKSKQQNVFKKFISFTKSVSDTVVKNVNRMINQTVTDTKANIYLGKKIVSNLLHKQKTSETKETIAQPGQSTNYTARKKKEERDKYFKDNDYFNVNRPDGYQRPVENPIGPKKYKYVARIPNPNGKGYYYFYSESAYKKWLDKNGGDEEKLVKEFGLKKNPATEEEDMAEVNEKKQQKHMLELFLGIRA